MIIKTSSYPINIKGDTLVTEQLQELIDEVSKAKGTLIIEKGIYLVSSLFLKSNMHLILEKDAMLLATTDESKYPILPTRVAGVEMPWYVGVLNCIQVENVSISGEGIINGSGPYWWNKYWGFDMQGGMRKEYDQLNLRWACDYDCMRIRNLLISESKNVTVSEITSYQSGFWNVHILYSNKICINKMNIVSNDLNSPSTDGIDIDSSYDVEVKNCILECNDDSICIKSGRDYDGLRVNKACHDIHIHHCEIKRGFGITIGSEVSGGVYNICINNIKYKGTDCGFRIKSSPFRKGYIKDVKYYNIEMEDVKYAFHMCLNWNPAYCLCEIPKNYPGEGKKHWEVLTKKVEESIPNTCVKNIEFLNIRVKKLVSSSLLTRAFHIEGFKDVPIQNLLFKDIEIECSEYGKISYVKNITFENLKITCSDKNHIENDIYDNR